LSKKFPTKVKKKENESISEYLLRQSCGISKDEDCPSCIFVNFKDIFFVPNSDKIGKSVPCRTFAVSLFRQQKAST